MSRPLDWNVEGLDWPHRQASRFVEAAGIRWHVQRLGQGPVLLFIHGTGGATHSWRDLMPLLANEFTCVAIDLPGHGFTAMPPAACLSLEGMARLLAGLLARLRVSPELVIGHSAGAAIAVRLQLHERLEADAIVSVNGALLPLRGMSRLVFPPAAKLMASNAMASRLFAWRARDPSVVPRLLGDIGSRLDARGEALYARLARNPVHVGAALGMMARWDVTPLKAMLPALRARLHLVAAARDRAVPPAQSRAVAVAVQHATFTLVEEAGHLAHEEMPARIAALIVDEWRRRRTAGRAQRKPAM